MDVTIRDYIGRARELTAEQVRKLKPGTHVIRHTFDRSGTHQTLEMCVVMSGRSRVLAYTDYYGLTMTKKIQQDPAGVGQDVLYGGARRMNGPSKDILRMIGKLRSMNPAQIYQWAQIVYRAGYMEGLREGEAEFDDAIVMDMDEAIKRGIDLDGLEV